MTENQDKDSYDILVDKCIDAYKKLLNNGMALDVCKVQGKMRAMILKDQRYITETRAIKASKYLNEIEEAESIYKAATRMGGAFNEFEADGDDGRDGGSGMSDKQIINARKEALQMQIKAADMRRELMNLTAESSDDNEDSAINFFFTALTAEEMRKIKQVEINEGSEDESEAFKAMKKEDENDVATQTLRRKEQTRVTHGLSPEEAPESSSASDQLVEEYND